MNETFSPSQIQAVSELLMASLKTVYFESIVESMVLDDLKRVHPEIAAAVNKSLNDARSNRVLQQRAEQELRVALAQTLKPFFAPSEDATMQKDLEKGLAAGEVENKDR
jgi:hypothetical protein